MIETPDPTEAPRQMERVARGGRRRDGWVRDMTTNEPDAARLSRLWARGEPLHGGRGRAFAWCCVAPLSSSSISWCKPEAPQTDLGARRHNPSYGHTRIVPRSHSRAAIRRFTRMTHRCTSDNPVISSWIVRSWRGLRASRTRYTRRAKGRRKNEKKEKSTRLSGKTMGVAHSFQGSGHGARRGW